MKTTLNVNDRLLADAKSLAAQQQTTLTRLIEEGLRLRMQVQPPQAGKQRFRLPVIEGSGGLMPGIDPTSNKSLLAAAGDE